MNASSFFENIGPTMFFAFIGTFASTFIVGGVIYAAGQVTPTPNPNPNPNPYSNPNPNPNPT